MGEQHPCPTFILLWEQWAPQWVPVALDLIFNRPSTQFPWFSDPFAHGLLNFPSHGHFPLLFKLAALEAASLPHLFPVGSSWVGGLLAIYFSLVCPQCGAVLCRAALLWQHNPAHCN